MYFLINFHIKIFDIVLQSNFSVLGNVDTRSYMTTSFAEDGTKVFTCHLCGKVFRMSSHMKTHLENVHLSGGHVQCGICNKKFKNKESLKTHFRNIHGLTKDQAY